MLAVPPSLLISALVLSAAVGLRWNRRAWPEFQDVIDALFYFLWSCSVLVWLCSYFDAQAKLVFGHPWVMWIASSAFWAAPVLVLRGFWRRLYAAAIVAAAVVLVIADLRAFSRSAFLWTLDFWPSFAWFSLGFQRVKSLFTPAPNPGLLGLLAQGVVVGLIPPLPHPDLGIARSRIIRKAGWILLACAFCVNAENLVWGFRQLYKPPDVNSEAAFIGELGVWNHHLFLLLRDLSEFGQTHFFPTKRDEAFWHVKDYAQPHQKLSRANPRHFGAARGYNLVLIQVSSLQEYVIGSRVMGQSVTPFLNSWRRKCLHFRRFYTQVNDGESIDAQVLAMTSLHPLSAGAITFRNRHEQWEALPQVLRRQHYHTVAIQAEAGWAWNELTLNKRFGFQKSLFSDDLGPIRPEDIEGWGMADEVFMERALPLVKQLPQPFFAYLVPSMVPHPLTNPFPEQLRHLNLGPMEDTDVGKYLQAMREFDVAMESLVHGIEQSNLRDNTVIALYGDHKAWLPPFPVLQEFLGVQQWNPAVEFDASRVPFLVFVPRTGLRGEISTPGGQVDIAPTLLGLLGIEPPLAFLGGSLLDNPSRVVAFESGLVFSQTQGFIPDGLGPHRSGCFSPLTGSTMAVANCDGLRESARRQLDASEAIHRFNLEPDLQAISATGSN